MTLAITLLADLDVDTRRAVVAGLSPAAQRELRHEASIVATETAFRPRGAAARLLETTAPEVLLSGPAGTGKSIGILMRLFSLAAHNPGMRGLMIRKTAVSLTASALVTWRTKVVDRALAAGAVEYYGGSSEEPPQYRFWNGSKIMLGGMDNPNRVMSTEYDFVFVQEAIELTENDWESLSTRLRNGVLPHMQLVGDTNPSHPTHWLKQRCDRGTTLLLESRHNDNPTLVDDAGTVTEFGATYLERLDRLTGVRLARLRQGLWVAAEGTIYEQFDPLVHVVDRFEIPTHWRRWWAVDFGYTNPFVLQCWAEDDDGRLWLYRELYHTGRLVEDHARHILRLVTDGTGRWLEPKPEAIICDHDAEGRATLRKHLRLPIRAARKEVLTGIEAVSVRLRAAGDGRPRLLLLRDSLVERDPDLDDGGLPCCTADEFPGYIWAPPQPGRPPKEQPVKENDHGMDTLRYLVMERDRGRPTLRTFGG
jgi:PBSX family phage terminase large subunit